MTESVTAARRLEPVGADSGFLRDVIAGLTASPKYLLPKYFYDEIGAELFEQITAQPEYYPTRCELEILGAHRDAIGHFIPAGAALIEFGSGSSRKVRLLLAGAREVAAYVPVDISQDLLAQEAQALRRDHPGLNVMPLAADFTRPFALPPALAGMPRVGFFPGSTIGNFEPQQAASFLRKAGAMLGRGSVMIIGVDLVKDPARLDAAYNDAAGVTARFNLNLLVRINRELGADFDLRNFRHHAFYDSGRARIEMHLVTGTPQQVRLAGRIISFRAGETIHTENSYKYTLASFTALAQRAGWSPAAAWTDAGGNFSIHALRQTTDDRRRTTGEDG